MLPCELGTLVLGVVMLQRVVEVVQHFSLLVVLGQSSWLVLMGPGAFVLALAGHKNQERKVVPFFVLYFALVVLYDETPLGLLELLVRDVRVVECLVEHVFGSVVECLVEHISGPVVWVEIVPEEPLVAVFVELVAECTKVCYFVGPLILLGVGMTM